MRLFSRETWSYAVLLVILFAMASLAVWQTIAYIETKVPNADFGTVAALIWSLTLGFMLIAGAFGLWAIQFSSEAEARRRIARVVTAMDYLHDGLLALDSRGRVTGSNPAVGRLAGAPVEPRAALVDLFPCLQETDVRWLLQSREPAEVERPMGSAKAMRTLRFRSQPSEGVILILISDVTSTEALRDHRLQANRLQLIGQLARGVANDFNTILCGIAGHAALMPRLRPGSPEMDESIRSIAMNADRGIALAGHLLDLSRQSGASQPSTVIADRAAGLGDILRDVLPAGWRLDVQGKPMPPTGLGGVLIDQVVLNLSQLVIESGRPPRSLVLLYGPPGAHPLLNIPETLAGGIVISGTPAETIGDMLPEATISEEYGVVQSVIASIMEGAGGALDVLHAVDGCPIFRLRLPLSGLADEQSHQPELPFDLGAYINNWKIVLGAATWRYHRIRGRLEALGARIVDIVDVAAMLAAIEHPPRVDAMILDIDLLGDNPDTLLKAIAKLSPRTGIVVLHAPTTPPPSLPSAGVLALPSNTPPDRVVMAMVEARSVATARARNLA